MWFYMVHGSWDVPACGLGDRAPHAMAPRATRSNSVFRYREPGVLTQMGPPAGSRPGPLVRGTSPPRVPRLDDTVPRSASHVRMAPRGVPRQFSPVASSGGPSQPACFAPRKVAMVFDARTRGAGRRPGGGRPVHAAASVCPEGPSAGLGRPRCLPLTTVTVTGVVAVGHRPSGPSLPFCFLEFRVFVFAVFGFRFAGREGRWLLSLGCRVTRVRSLRWPWRRFWARGPRGPGHAAVWPPCWARQGHWCPSLAVAFCPVGESSGLSWGNVPASGRRPPESNVSARLRRRRGL